MYLTYLDESGVPNNSNENFVVAGIIINEQKWIDCDNKIDTLKKKLFGDNWELYEFHLVEIVHGNGLYQKVSIEERIKIIKELFILINELEIRVVASLIKTGKMYAGKDIEHWGMRLLFERIVLNIDDLNQKLKESGNDPQMGIIIIDSIDKKYDDKRRLKFKDFFDFGTNYSDNKYLIEDVLFTVSHWRNMVQIADAVGYVINHHHKNNHNKHKGMCDVLEFAWNITNNKMVCGSTTHKKSFSFKIFP